MTAMARQISPAMGATQANSSSERGLAPALTRLSRVNTAITETAPSANVMVPRSHPPLAVIDPSIAHGPALPTTTPTLATKAATRFGK
jgi:hypothetical protein